MASRVRALLFETAFLIEECLQVFRTFIYEASIVQPRSPRLLAERVGTHHLFHCCHCLLLLQDIRQDVQRRTVSLLHTQHSVILVVIRWHRGQKVRLRLASRFLWSHLERFRGEVAVADVCYTDIIVLKFLFHPHQQHVALALAPFNFVFDLLCVQILGSSKEAG